jgi:hypothetical protein
MTLAATCNASRRHSAAVGGIRMKKTLCCTCVRRGHSGRPDGPSALKDATDAPSAAPIAAPATAQQGRRLAPVLMVHDEMDILVTPPSAPPRAVAPVFSMPLLRLRGYASAAAAAVLLPATTALPPVVALGGAVLGAGPLMQHHLAAMADLQAQVCLCCCQ